MDGLEPKGRHPLMDVDHIEFRMRDCYRRVLTQYRKSLYRPLPKKSMRLPNKTKICITYFTIQKTKVRLLIQVFLSKSAKKG